MPAVTDLWCGYMHICGVAGAFRVPHIYINNTDIIYAIQNPLQESIKPAQPSMLLLPQTISAKRIYLKCAAEMPWKAFNILRTSANCCHKQVIPNARVQQKHATARFSQPKNPRQLLLLLPVVRLPRFAKAAREAY